MAKRKIQEILIALNSVILGKEEAIKLSLCALLARGHLLLEDRPGMGKTTLSHALAAVVGLQYQRIQFTSDLLPSDILGGEIFNPRTEKFTLHKGPIFTELLLADEINRTTPKSQSALLEAMEERQVTIDNETYPLSDHFFVIATQNPNQEGGGTFPLPESQLDRFLLRISLGYPSYAAELAILKGAYRSRSQLPTEPIISKEELTQLQKAAASIEASDVVLDYILRIAQMSRTDARFQRGLSPRGTQALLSAARAYALIEGRHYLIPDDVRALLPAVCGHRLQVGGLFEPRDQKGAVDWLLDEVEVLI